MSGDLADSTAVSRKQLVGWLLVAHLPLKWILRIVERLGDIDFVVTHVHDPGWVGTLLRMFSDVVRGPEIIIFILGVGWLVYLHRESSPLKASVPAQRVASLSSLLPQQDNEKREEIEFFFQSYIRPLNKSVSHVGSRLREHLRKSQTGKDQDLTLFVADYGKGIHGRATGKLENEFVIPENDGIDPLHRKLREFCDAYHGGVNCINHLVQFSSYPLKEDPDYEKWRDQHKLFHLELTKLLAKEKDLSTLKKGLGTDWPDIPR